MKRLAILLFAGLLVSPACSGAEAPTTAPAAAFFPKPPEGHEARRIVFVCDVAGTSSSGAATARRELQRAVRTPENKRDAITFLHDKVTPRGETNPIPALETAFAQKPQVVFLLTDGDFPDNHAAIKRIRELNLAAKASVNTIAFVDPSDTDTAFYKALQTIADENHGQYKVVKEDELKP